MSLTRFQKEEIATIKGMAKYDLERAANAALSHLRGYGLGDDRRIIPHNEIPELALYLSVHGIDTEEKPKNTIISNILDIVLKL